LFAITLQLSARNVSRRIASKRVIFQMLNSQAETSKKYQNFINFLLMLIAALVGFPQRTK
jgi:hypothetical protein